MRSAIAFAAMIIVFGIFMPNVLHAMIVFLQTFFEKGTALLNTLPTSPADISHFVR